MKKYFKFYIWPLLLVTGFILFFVGLLLKSSLNSNSEFSNLSRLVDNLFSLVIFLTTFIGGIGTFIILPILVVINGPKKEKTSISTPPQPPEQ